MQEIEFKNFIKLQRGYDLPRKNMIDGVYPVVGSTSIIGHHNEYKQDPPGVITGRSGSLGTVQYIKQKYWPHNTSLWVKDFKGNFPRYVYYFLQNFPLAHFNSGAGVPTLNRNDLDVYKINVHDFNSQCKVVSILSAYDDLIENNNRRIKILEQMAQTIYDEWFVKFRFPDHSKVKMVDSELGKIPAEWKVATVKDIIKRLPSGKKYDNKSVLPKGKVPVLDQGRSGIIGYHNNEPDIDASENSPIIVFANHTCYQRLIIFPFSAIQNVIPILPSEDNPRDIYWLHWATKDLIHFNDYKGHYPEFTTKRLALPSADLCAKFGSYIKPYVLLQYKLEQKNKNLQETRDILLPKLISGEIDVEDMDIDIGDVDDR